MFKYNTGTLPSSVNYFFTLKTLDAIVTSAKPIIYKLIWVNTKMLINYSVFMVYTFGIRYKTTSV